MQPCQIFLFKILSGTFSCTLAETLNSNFVRTTGGHNYGSDAV